jgi:galactokinase
MFSGRVFKDQFGQVPSVVAVSPGRVNLIGEHIDYLGGSVMPIAIDRHLTIEAAPTEDGNFEILPLGTGFGRPVCFGKDDLGPRHEPTEKWLNYLLGVIAGYRESGAAVPGFRAVIHSALPAGAGLSASAALETAAALVVETLSGVSRDVVTRALLCQRAEHKYAGVPCGIMDQLAVGAGRAGQVMQLDCGELTYRHFPLPQDLVVLVADSGVKHALGDGEYRKRREDCDAVLTLLGCDSFRSLTLATIRDFREALGDRLFRRARHAVTEMARVVRFGEALEKGDFDALGEAMQASHASLRDDYEVSCPELDHLVASAGRFGRDRGLIGTRMTGGGFGGSTVSLVRAAAAADLKTHLEAEHLSRYGRELHCFITSAVDGATARAVE